MAPTPILPSPGISVTRWPIFRHPVPAYGCALGLTAIAFLLRWDLEPTLGRSGPLIFFMIAAALSAFLFGRGPGIVSTLSGIALGYYFFAIPHYPFHLNSRGTTVALISVTIQGLLISFCAGYLHRALRLRVQAEEDMRRLYEVERQAREAANELNQTKDYFLAVLSHELRGPLSAISYCVSDRVKDTTVPNELREDFALIERNARMQSRLIDDLLDLTRLTRGKLEIEVRPLDIHLLLAEAVRTSGTDGQQALPVPALHLRAHETRVLGDRDRLLQVFWNILRNAEKFTPMDGHVDVETFEPAVGRIGIRIRDTGIGLTPEALERIFRPFEQAGRETNKKHGGLGLGLAIARGIVELHDGTLSGESAGIGQGTTFTIDLPVISRNDTPLATRRSGVDRPARSSARSPVGVA